MSIYIIDNGGHFANHEIWFVDVGEYSYLADKWLKFLQSRSYDKPYLIGITDRVEWRHPGACLMAIKDWIIPWSFFNLSYLVGDEGYSEDKFLYKRYRQDYYGNWIYEDETYCLDEYAVNCFTKEDWEILYTLWGTPDEDDTNSLYLLFLRNMNKEKVICMSKDKCVDDRLKIGPFVLVEE